MTYSNKDKILADGGDSAKTKKKKLAILVNIISPYRLPVYGYLARWFETIVLHGGREPGRKWDIQLHPALKAEKVWGFQIPGRKATGVPGVWDRRFIHFNLGLIWRLPLYRPDCIISNEMGFRTLIALAYGKLAGIRVWIWWGGTVHSEKNISMGRRLLRPMIVRIAKRWISYGSTTTEYLESIGVARRQILQIQNCVEQEVFLDEPKNATTWFEDMPHPVILTVGQLIPRKGLDKLIEACGRIASRGLEFSLVLVGEGSDRERLEELARQCSIKNFKIVPHQHPSQLNEIYRSSDVFVFPTLEDIWGLAVNEAILTGTPVLCSKYAGCAPELLPASNIFDATYPASFDAALDQVFNHSIRPPDRSKLRRWQEVGEMIHRSLVDGSPCDHAMVSGRKSYEISSFSRGDIDIGRACKSQMD